MKKRLVGKKRASTSRSGFNIYQEQATATIHGKYADQKGQIASMFGLASETGSILDSYKRYLRDSIDRASNTEFLRIELGDLLWYVAVVANACGLKLQDIAADNLRNARAWVRRKGGPGIRPIACEVPPKTEPATPVIRDFYEYQVEASKCSDLNFLGPAGSIGPLCGLSSATAAILACPKNKQGEIDLQKNKKYFLKELGDLLWYLSAVATASNLNLGDIAAYNLARARDLYPSRGQLPKLMKGLRRLDETEKATERFPRQMILCYTETQHSDGPPIATQRLIEAIPNEFPNGPIAIGKDKKQGFVLGEHVGDMTNDNSRRADGYRYHDAIHFGFVAVLGWSPTMRHLLSLKRRSKEATDRDEDGARAIYTEEGLAAILARLAPRRMGFLGENSVDGEVIATAMALVRDTEVEGLPGWLWRRAISQGFNAMQELEKNQGGYLLVDMDARELKYSKVKPDVGTKKRN